jgi:hypothetical protein
MSIPSFEKLVKMQNDPENWSPLMKQYNGLVADDARLTQTIVVQMQQMISREIAPTWENMSRTKTWMTLALNLSPDSQFKYEEKWRSLYQQLMAVPDESKTADTKDAGSLDTEEPTKSSDASSSPE